MTDGENLNESNRKGGKESPEVSVDELNEIIREKTKDVLSASIKLTSNVSDLLKFSIEPQNVELRTSALRVLSGIFNEFYECKEFIFDHENLSISNMTSLLHQMNCEANGRCASLYKDYIKKADIEPEAIDITNTNASSDIQRYKAQFASFKSKSNPPVPQSEMEYNFDNSASDECIDNWIKSFKSSAGINEGSKTVYLEDIDEFRTAMLSVAKSCLLFVAIFFDRTNSYEGIPTQIIISDSNTFYVINYLKLYRELSNLFDILHSVKCVKIFINCFEDLKQICDIHNFSIENCSLLIPIENYLECFASHVEIDHIKQLLKMINNEFHFDIYDCFYNPKDSSEEYYWRKKLASNSDFLYFKKICSEVNNLLKSYTNSGKQSNIFSKTEFKKQLSQTYCHQSRNLPYFNDFGIEKLKTQIFTSNLEKKRIQAELINKIDSIRQMSARSKDISPLSILPNYLLFKIVMMVPSEKSKLIACCMPMPIHLESSVLNLIYKECRKSFVELSKTSKTDQEICTLSDKESESILSKTSTDEQKNTATSPKTDASERQANFLHLKISHGFSTYHDALSNKYAKPRFTSNGLYIAKKIPKLQYYLPSTSNVFKFIEHWRLKNLDTAGTDSSNSNNLPPLRIFKHIKRTKSVSKRAKLSMDNDPIDSLQITKPVHQVQKNLSTCKKVNIQLNNTNMGQDFDYETSARKLNDQINDASKNQDKYRIAKKSNKSKLKPKAAGVKTKLKDTIKRLKNN